MYRNYYTSISNSPSIPIRVPYPLDIHVPIHMPLYIPVFSLNFPLHAFLLPSLPSLILPYGYLTPLHTS